ncbi:MAG TPA: PqqD family protein [Blastocatellia bacterium]|nr:PqqD family protein [Blastocatellia bacterium]
MNTQAILPAAREEGLIIQEMADEVLVYDRERYKAHCLNKTAALVWRHCDGKTTVADIARLVGDELQLPVGEEVVWLGVEQLQKAHLLSDGAHRLRAQGGMSRRRALQKLGWAAAVGLPLVTSIIAPRAVEASTCAIVCSSDSQCLGTPGCPPVCNTMTGVCHN